MDQKLNLKRSEMGSKMGSKTGSKTDLKRVLKIGHFRGVKKHHFSKSSPKRGFYCKMKQKRKGLEPFLATFQKPIFLGTYRDIEREARKDLVTET